MPEILCRPLPATILASSLVTNPANMFGDRLGRVANFTGANGYVALDLGASISIDTIAALANNASATGIKFTVTSFTSSANAIANTSPVALGQGDMWASPEAGLRIHRQGLHTFGPVTVRYLRVTVSAPTTIGRLVIGKAFSPVEQRDYEWDYKVVDLGENRRASNALEDPTIRGKVMEYSWSWSGLTQAEARGTMLDLLAYAGTTRDLLVCLDDAAADRHNLIGYGKLPDPVIVPNTAEDWYAAKFTLLSRLVLSL